METRDLAPPSVIRSSAQPEAAGASSSSGLRAARAAWAALVELVDGAMAGGT
jgi:hypothetical protein